MTKRTWIGILIAIVVMAGGLLYRHCAQEVDSRGATRLMRALEENDTEKTGQLLSEETVHVRDKAGQTPLFYAARHAQHPQVLHKLILAGADPLATDKNGQTPLIAAAQYNPHPVIITVLARQLGQGAAPQQNKDRALVVAAQHNTFTIIKALLAVRARPAYREPNGKGAADYLPENPLLSDTEKTDLRQVMLLLEILEEREKFSPIQRVKKPVLRQMAQSSASQETEPPTSAPSPAKNDLKEPQ